MTKRSLITRVSMLVVFMPVCLQAVYWLHAGHPEASQTRHFAVWIQAIASGVIGLWMLVGRINEDTVG